MGQDESKSAGEGQPAEGTSWGHKCSSEGTRVSSFWHLTPSAVHVEDRECFRQMCMIIWCTLGGDSGVFPTTQLLIAHCWLSCCKVTRGKKNTEQGLNYRFRFDLTLTRVQ